MGLDNRHVFALGRRCRSPSSGRRRAYAVRTNFDPAIRTGAADFRLEAVIIGGLGSLGHAFRRIYSAWLKASAPTSIPVGNCSPGDLASSLSSRRAPRGCFQRYIEHYRCRRPRIVFMTVEPHRPPIFLSALARWPGAVLGGPQDLRLLARIYAYWRSRAVNLLAGYAGLVSVPARYVGLAATCCFPHHVRGVSPRGRAARRHPGAAGPPGCRPWYSGCGTLLRIGTWVVPRFSPYRRAGVSAGGGSGPACRACHRIARPRDARSSFY